MIEKELKSLLNRETFGETLKSFKWSDSINQTNYYYADKLGVLKAENITVRVRCIDGKHKLQVKSPISENGALHIKNEFEEKLAGLPNKIESKRLSEIIGREIEDAYLIGQLETHRHIFWWDESTQICLDENKYLGYIDYEIEIEYTDKVQDELISCLSSLSINFNKNTRGKYSRFIERSEQGEK